MGNINQDLNRDRLEKLLNEEKEENVLLNNKVEALENTLNSEIEKNLKYINRIRDLESKLSRYPFELLEGEKIISVIFYSVNQNVLTSILFKNTDLFANIELKLYEQYPDYKNQKYFFISNGRTINKYKNLKENGIKNNDIILLNKINYLTPLNKL